MKSLLDICKFPFSEGDYYHYDSSPSTHYLITKIYKITDEYMICDNTSVLTKRVYEKYSVPLKSVRLVSK